MAGGGAVMGRSEPRVLGWPSAYLPSWLPGTRFQARPTRTVLLTRSTSPGMSAVASENRQPEATRKSRNGHQRGVNEVRSKANSSGVRKVISRWTVLGSLTPAAGLAAIRPSLTAAFKQPDRKPALFCTVLPDAPASRIAFTHREMSERASVDSG